jgi:hypothetical protein
MIAVDRLILAVPGMSPERAERLARAIGAMVAEAGTASANRVEASVDPNATDASILAALTASLRTGAR